MVYRGEISPPVPGRSPDLTPGSARGDPQVPPGCPLGPLGPRIRPPRDPLGPPPSGGRISSPKPRSRPVLGRTPIFTCGGRLRRYSEIRRIFQKFANIYEKSIFRPIFALPQKCSKKSKFCASCAPNIIFVIIPILRMLFLVT